MKKIICFILSISMMVALVLPMAVSAAEETFVFATEEDYAELGVNIATKAEADADTSLYNVDGKVVNFRASTSPAAFKGATDERWLIPGWGNAYSKESSLYLGSNSYDMSKVTSITIDWLANKAAGKTNVVALTKDAAGTEVVAIANITELDLAGNMAEKYTSTLTVTDATYNGPVYLYMNAQTRMFLGNLQITVDNTIGDTGSDNTGSDNTGSDNTGSDSGNTETNPETGDFGFIALASAAVSSIVIKKKKEI